MGVANDGNQRQPAIGAAYGRMSRVSYPQSQAAKQAASKQCLAKPIVPESGNLVAQGLSRVKVSDGIILRLPDLGTDALNGHTEESVGRACIPQHR